MSYPRLDNSYKKQQQQQPHHRHGGGGCCDDDKEIEKEPAVVYCCNNSGGANLADTLLLAQTLVSVKTIQEQVGENVCPKNCVLDENLVIKPTNANWVKLPLSQDINVTFDTDRIILSGQTAIIQLKEFVDTRCVQKVCVQVEVFKNTVGDANLKINYQVGDNGIVTLSNNALVTPDDSDEYTTYCVELPKEAQKKEVKFSFLYQNGVSGKNAYGIKDFTLVSNIDSSEKTLFELVGCPCIPANETEPVESLFDGFCKTLTRLDEIETLIEETCTGGGGGGSCDLNIPNCACNNNKITIGEAIGCPKCTTSQDISLDLNKWTSVVNIINNPSGTGVGTTGFISSPEPNYLGFSTVSQGTTTITLDPEKLKVCGTATLQIEIIKGSGNNGGATPVPNATFNVFWNSPTGSNIANLITNAFNTVEIPYLALNSTNTLKFEYNYETARMTSLLQIGIRKITLLYNYQTNLVDLIGCPCTAGNTPVNTLFEGVCETLDSLGQFPTDCGMQMSPIQNVANGFCQTISNIVALQTDVDIIVTNIGVFPACGDKITTVAEGLCQINKSLFIPDCICQDTPVTVGEAIGCTLCTVQQEISLSLADPSDWVISDINNIATQNSVVNGDPFNSYPYPTFMGFKNDTNRDSVTATNKNIKIPSSSACKKEAKLIIEYISIDSPAFNVNIFWNNLMIAVGALTNTSDKWKTLEINIMLDLTDGTNSLVFSYDATGASSVLQYGIRKISIEYTTQKSLSDKLGCPPADAAPSTVFDGLVDNYNLTLAQYKAAAIQSQSSNTLSLLLNNNQVPKFTYDPVTKNLTFLDTKAGNPTFLDYSNNGGTNCQLQLYLINIETASLASNVIQAATPQFAPGAYGSVTTVVSVNSVFNIPPAITSGRYLAVLSLSIGTSNGSISMASVMYPDIITL